jgi:hypothetical protein
MSSQCRAKNPATCSHHGSPISQIDFEQGKFLINHEKTLTDNKKRSEVFKMMLSKKEEEALNDYLSQEYVPLNRYLHSDEKDEHYEEKVAVLDSVLAKAVLDEPKVVYRATSPYDSEGNRVEFSSLEEAEEYYRKKYPIGSIVEFPGFTSTTEDPNCLCDFIARGWDTASETQKTKTTREEYQRITGTSGLTGIIYEFKTSKGASVASFSQTYADKEQEILLPRGSKFRVVNVHPNKKMTFQNRMVYETREEQRMITVVQLEEI